MDGILYRKGTERMEIIDYFRAPEAGGFLEELGRCEWAAGRFLRRVLEEGSFHARYGERARVLMLADGPKLASFCTYAEQDEIRNSGLTPWAGFVYTAPEYRGRRLAGRLLAEAKALAREEGYSRLWISTGETGLYEKYGAVFDQMLRSEREDDSRIYRMNTYGFFGWEKADMPARIADYPGIGIPRDLYNALWHLWKRETCAPRMQKDWSEENRTLGQCSITAFLAQDIFGGLVYGVPLEEGGYHCFNVIGDTWFDLTSEQFGGKKPEYSLKWEQTRHDHFMKEEKKARYETLKAALAGWTKAAR